MKRKDIGVSTGMDEKGFGLWNCGLVSLCFVDLEGLTGLMDG